MFRFKIMKSFDSVKTCKINEKHKFKSNHNLFYSFENGCHISIIVIYLYITNYKNELHHSLKH